jgi:prepilin-type N-terminal cleavage/methylation domain-containing protein
MPTTSPTGRGDGGFSLLELILVMGLLALSAAMAAPSLARFARHRLAADAVSDVLALTLHAQSLAATHAQPFRLHIESDACWVDAVGEVTGGRTSLSRRRRFPLGVSAQWQSLAGQDNPGYVEFRPDGSHDPAVVAIIGRDGDVTRIGSLAPTEPFARLTVGAFEGGSL